MFHPSPLSSPAIRALVVEPDDAARRQVSEALRDGGWEVSDCVDLDRGRELFQGHRLVVTPLSGRGEAVKDFVSWVRARAGADQPWIIAMGANRPLEPGESPDRFGVNDIVSGPLDAVRLARRLEVLAAGAAPRIAGWETALGRVLAEGSGAAVAVLDRELRFLYMNHRWRSEFQIPDGVNPKCSYRDIFPDAHPAWLQIYADCLNGHGSRILEDVIERTNGEEEGVCWEVHPWRSGTAISGLILICRLSVGGASPETGESARVCEGEEGSHGLISADFREMAEAAPFGMMLLNDDAEVLYANPQHRAVLGFSVRECGGLDAWLSRGRVADGDFQARAVAEWWEHVWRRRAPWVFTMRSAEGILKEVEFRPSPLPGHRLLLTIFDVTDARLEEQAVRASETRYRSLFQECSTAMALINPVGHISEVNPAFERLTGCSRREARRAGLGEFLSPEALDVFRMHTKGSAPSREWETEIRTRDGRIIPARVHLALVQCGTTGVSYAACSIHPVRPHETTSTAPDTGPNRFPDGPDGIVILDSEGRILDQRDSTDVPGLLNRDTSSSDSFTVVYAELAERIPLIDLIARASGSPDRPIRQVVRLPLPDSSPPETAGFEIRLHRFNESDNPESTRFALFLRCLPPDGPNSVDVT